MAVAFANTINNSSETDASSYLTASITPTADTLQLLAVSSRHGTLAPNTPTATGNDLTWVEILNTLFDTSGSQRKLTLFRAMGASPTAGQITIDFGGQTQTGAIWALTEVTGMDISGTNGSGAIAQSKANQDTGGTGTGLVVTLDSTPATDSGVFGTFAIGDGTITINAGSGFTQLTDRNIGAESNIRQETQYDAAGADTTCDVTLSGGDGNSEIGGIAVEVKIAGTATIPGNTTQFLMMMGLGT